MAELKREKEELRNERKELKERQERLEKREAELDAIDAKLVENPNEKLLDMQYQKWKRIHQQRDELKDAWKQEPTIAGARS